MRCLVKPFGAFHIRPNYHASNMTVFPIRSLSRFSLFFFKNPILSALNHSSTVAMPACAPVVTHTTGKSYHRPLAVCVCVSAIRAGFSRTRRHPNLSNFPMK